MAMACNWPEKRASLGICLWTAQRWGISSTQAVASPVWHQKILYWWLGSIWTIFASRSSRSGQTEDTEDWAQTSATKNKNQAFDTKNNLLFQVWTDARPRNWNVHQSLWVWATNLEAIDRSKTLPQCGMTVCLSIQPVKLHWAIHTSVGPSRARPRRQKATVIEQKYSTRLQLRDLSMRPMLKRRLTPSALAVT